MSLSDYNTLTEQFSKLELGVDLPKLTAAKLKVASTQVTQSQLIDRITTFNAQGSTVQGWVQYRDETVICAVVPTRTDIIEAQYSDDQNNSLQIKLLSGNNYLATSISMANKSEQATQHDDQQQSEYIYRDQRLVIRNNLKESAKIALYRLWWQQQQGENQGRWQPILQQFIGFELTAQGEK